MCSWEGVSLACLSSPVTPSIAAAATDRACTSSPTLVRSENTGASISQLSDRPSRQPLLGNPRTCVSEAPAYNPSARAGHSIPSREPDRLDVWKWPFEGLTSSAGGGHPYCWSAKTVRPSRRQEWALPSFTGGIAPTPEAESDWTRPPPRVAVPRLVLRSASTDPTAATSPSERTCLNKPRLRVSGYTRDPRGHAEVRSRPVGWGHGQQSWVGLASKKGSPGAPVGGRLLPRSFGSRAGIRLARGRGSLLSTGSH